MRRCLSDRQEEVRIHLPTRPDSEDALLGLHYAKGQRRETQGGEIVKTYTLDRLKEIAEEYIGETEHGVADDPATWQEAIRDFILALEHW